MSGSKDGHRFDNVNDLISRLEEAVQESARIRSSIEGQMRRKPVFPERRQPRHWQHLPERNQDTPSES